MTTRVVHGATTSSVVAVDNQRLENKLTELTFLVRQMAMGQAVPQIQQTCAVGDITIFSFGRRHTPSLSEHHQQQSQKQCNPFSPIYNPEWRNYPNLRYGPGPTPQQQQKYTYHQQQQPAHPQYQQLQQGSGALPSQPVVNPKGNVSTITLRSGKELTNYLVQTKIVFDKCVKSSEGSGSEEGVLDNSMQQQQIPLPFPSRASKSKRIPRYAKFLKELCTYKRNLKKRKVQTVSSLSRSSLPQKCGDPRTFSIPCTIGESSFASALLDLGASINVMSSAVYTMLHLGDLKPTNVIIQLAN
ncbi:uncharacterized protein LOC113855536 [Abrus precatorius]|uniref:Uncharacterized protein LOC113855536 n=1 Tax=Abrus precatorius TaxID=3816 RepID=A0A8B8KGN2_ABRPR|nr:uncharacterized protein LOC113855536 [Abrus precatorius]